MQSGVLAVSATQRRIVFLLVVLHCLIVLPLAATLNLGTDESFSLATTSGSLSEAIHGALKFELQPPFYFAVLKLWRFVLGDSIFAARLLSIACAFGAVLLSAQVSVRFLPRVHAPRLVAVLALHPFVIWCAVEIRLYAMMLLISVLQLITFHDGFLGTADGCLKPERQSACRSRVWYLVLATIGLYCHYFSGFLLVAAAGVLFVQRRWRPLGVYFAVMAIVSVCFSPMVFVVPGQVGEHTEGSEAVSIVAGLKAVLWQAEHYLLPVSVRATESQLGWSLWIFRLAMILVPVGLCWKFREVTFWKQNVSALTLLCGCLVLFTPAVALTGPELFEFRHGVVLFVPLLVGVLALVAGLGGNRAVGWLSCVMACFGASALLNNYAELAKGGDWRRVAGYLEQNEAEREPVVVFIPWAGLPLAQHYSGKNPLVVVPRPEECVTFNMNEYVLNDVAEIEEPVEHRVPDADVVWLVTSGPRRYLGVDFHWEVLDRWVADGFVVESEVAFYGSTVRKLRRRTSGLTATGPGTPIAHLVAADESVDCPSGQSD